ncbi:MAG: hypothetical protein UHH95_01135 [Oscillospiraceae bacterium]|nr:hypothetical protein [Oscillospiraceae bacterium]
MKSIKKVALALLVVSALMLSSCENLGATADVLIAPPVLFEEQDDIMKALRASAGENISLEYPRTGENRSAFLLSDLNSDGKNEVIAFYRPSSDETTQDVIHINILKSEQNEWTSVCDIVGEAAGIDRVSVGSFGGRREIIVGWELMRDREKTLVCYSLSGKTPSRDYSATYVEFSVADFWLENEGDELITLNYSQTTENLVQPTQHARLITLSEGAFKIMSSTPLDSRVTGYKSCIAGKYNGKRTAFFLDGVIDAATVNSQILTVGEQGQIQNPLLLGDKTDEKNVHKPTLLTQDIDGDGILEVPHQEAVTGYESVPESEKIYKTVWKRLMGKRLEKSAVMYISTAFGIRVTIPRRLDGKVTIKPITAQNELVFYEYEDSLEKSTKEIFSIRVSEKELYESEDGHEVLKSTDYKVVTVKITDEESELCPTWETLYKIVEIV